MMLAMRHPLNQPAPRGTPRRFVQDVRKARGETQEAFAAELKVSRQTVANWESGKFEPSSETMNQLRKWAVEAGMSPNLLTQSPDPTPGSSGKTEDDLVGLLRLMTPEQQFQVVLFAAKVLGQEAQASRPA